MHYLQYIELITRVPKAKMTTTTCDTTNVENMFKLFNWSNGRKNLTKGDYSIMYFNDKDHLIK